MRRKEGFLQGLQMKIEGWIGGAWSMGLLVLLFSPCAALMIIAIALAPGINRNSDAILSEGEVYLHWTFRLISEYASVLFIFLFFLAILAYLAISNLSRAAGHAATVIAKVYLPAPQGQLPAPQVTYHIGAPSQEVLPVSTEVPTRPALPAPQTPAGKIAKVLKGLRLEASVEELAKGPQVITYGLKPGFKSDGKLTTVSQLKNKAEDIALALSVEGVRFHLHGGYLALEVTRREREYVSLFELFRTGEWTKREAAVPLALGKDTYGKWTVGDLAKLPHLLIGGATGGGKSVALNVILCGLIEHFSSSELILKLVDPKSVELVAYSEFGERIVEPQDFETLLRQLVAEMEQRYTMISLAKKKSLESYNETAEKPIPYIVCIIDEYGDLVLSKDFSDETQKLLIKLAQKARAIGIYFILATQRPDAEIVTGLIKANFPGRLALKVTNNANARIVLDENGPEDLAGFGDALYKDHEGLIRRVQIGYASDKEIEAFLGSVAVRTRWELVPGPKSSFSEPVGTRHGTRTEPARNQLVPTSDPARTHLGTTSEPASPQEEIERMLNEGVDNFDIAKEIAKKYPRLSANAIQRMVGMRRPDAHRAVREVRGDKEESQKVYVNGHSKEASYA